MSKVIVVFLLLVGIMASSYATSKSVIPQKTGLSRYECASITNNDTYHIPAQLMEYETRPLDAIENSRLKLVNGIRIGRPSPNQRSKLLMIKYGAGTLEEESVVTVDSIDYLIDRPIASYRGAYITLGFSVSADIRGAIKRVAKQIAGTFPK